MTTAVIAAERRADAGRPTRRSAALVTVALTALAATLFLAHASRVLNAPFGDSHDGRNAAMWASGSRSLRERGLIASRLGARAREREAYANHPPLIYVETAVAEAVAGGLPAASRAPAWIGSVVALALLAKLLLERGLRPAAVGGAVVLIAATPMFLVYGTMLDTPVTALPFALAVLLLWLRAVDGQRAVHPVAVGLVTALATLAGWQALLVAAAAAGWGAIGLRRRREPRGVRLAAVVGFAAGVAGVLAWTAWAYGGSLRPLLDQYLFRAGRSRGSIPFGVFLSVQAAVIAAMFGGVVLVLGAAGLAAALRRRPLRILAAVALAVTVPYTVLLPMGATNHDYWNFWLVLPLALGVAVAVDWVLSVATIPAERVVAVAAAALAVVMTASLVVHPPPAERVILDGVAAGRVLDHADYPAGQATAWYAGRIGEVPNWLSFSARRPAVRVPDLGALAAGRPDDLVFVGRVRCGSPGPTVTYRLERAADAALDPPAAGCPA